MDFLKIKLFPQNLIEAIGSTLVHSLWQGLVLAAITAIIVVSTRRTSAAKRYNWLIAALAFFAAAVVVTFILEFNSRTVHDVTLNPVAQTEHQLIIPQTAPKFEQPITPEFNLKNTAISFINKYANSIVLIWFMIVCARSLQLATGLQGIYHLRRRSMPIDPGLEIIAKQLALKLGISQIIGVAESGLAKVPMVIGHLKPLILIPVGLTTTLSFDEIEAILIHELAHIRRRDYLVNILQTLLEIIFFFNPAVLWISTLIRTERENCCDDIAVAQSSSKVNYIKALVSCQEYTASAPVFAMALNGNKNHLLTRVKRILSNDNQSLNRMEKSLLAVCLVSAGLLTAAFSNADKINILVTKTAKAVVHIAAGIDKKDIAPKIETKKTITLPAANMLAITTTNPVRKPDTGKETKFKVYHSGEVSEHAYVSVQNGLFTTQLYKQDGILYQLNYKNSVLSSVQVNGKNIPNDHITSYQSIIDQIQRKNNMVSAKPSDAIYITDKAGPTPGTSEKTVTPTKIQQEMEALIKQKQNEINKRTTDFDQFVTYGDAYRNTGHYQDALDFYKKAESINPLNPSLEKKITDTKIEFEEHKTPEERQKDLLAKTKADEDAKNQEQINSFVAHGDYYITKQRYQDAMDSYKKAEAINPLNADVEQKIAYTQKELNQYVADSVNKAYRNGSYYALPKLPHPATTYKKPAAPSYPTNYAYTAAGKGAIARKDSVERAHIIDDMMKDGLIQTTDNLSFKISTKEFIVNGKKQPEDVYQKYRAKYVKVVGHGDWSWYYNFDTDQKRTVTGITDEPKK